MFILTGLNGNVNTETVCMFWDTKVVQVLLRSLITYFNLLCELVKGNGIGKVKEYI